MKMTIRKRSTKTLPKLKREAEKWFHWYIRLRDCQKTTGTLHRGFCFTCDSSCDLPQFQAGHFCHNKLDFDEDNLHGQCVRCNCYLSGNLGIYAIRLIKEKGQEFVDDLIRRSHEVKKYTRTELEELIIRYKTKVKELV